MTRMTKKQRSSDHLRVSGESRSALQPRAAAWREVGLTIGVLWSVLGAACFFVGAQWVYDESGTELATAPSCSMCSSLWAASWSSASSAGVRAGGEKASPNSAGGAPPAHRCSSLPSSMGWPGRRWPMPEAETRWPGLWQRPIMMAIGLVLAFGEEIAVRGLILDRLERCGSSRLLQVVIAAAVVGRVPRRGRAPHLALLHALLLHPVRRSLDLLRLWRSQPHTGLRRPRHDPFPGRPRPHAGNPLRSRGRADHPALLDPECRSDASSGAAKHHEALHRWCIRIKCDESPQRPLRPQRRLHRCTGGLHDLLRGDHGVLLHSCAEPWSTSGGFSRYCCPSTAMRA